MPTENAYEGLNNPKSAYGIKMKDDFGPHKLCNEWNQVLKFHWVWKCSQQKSGLENIHCGLALK